MNKLDLSDLGDDAIFAILERLPLKELINQRKLSRGIRDKVDNVIFRKCNVQVFKRLLIDANGEMVTTYDEKGNEIETRYKSNAYQNFEKVKNKPRFTIEQLMHMDRNAVKNIFLYMPIIELRFYENDFKELFKEVIEERGIIVNILHRKIGFKDGSESIEDETKSTERTKTHIFKKDGHIYKKVNVKSTDFDKPYEVETNYKDDIKNGNQTTWYINGKVRSIVPYKNGVIHGIVRRYGYEDGEEIIRYIEGVRQRD